MKLEWIQDKICKGFMSANYHIYRLDAWGGGITIEGTSGVELVGHELGEDISMGRLDFDIMDKGFDKVLMECIDYIADDYDRVKRVFGRTQHITLSVDNLFNIFAYEGCENGEEKKAQG